MEINLEDYTCFIVTGKLYRSNTRFRLSYSGNYSGFSTAMSINLWQGSVWGLLYNGNRKLLKRV